MFTRGAVDLGALRDRAAAQAAAEERAASGASAPAPAGGAVVDVTEATLQAEVLERSLQAPVVVFFGSARSPQSGELLASLQRLAAEANGRWVLARVDVDVEQNIAMMFRIQAVPTVYAVIGGQPVDGFAGVVPEAQLRQFVDAVVKAGGGEPAPEPEDPRLAAAEDALVDGDFDRAAATYQEILNSRPADDAAQAGLAQVELLRRVAGVDPQAALRDAQARPDDVPAQTLAADVEVLSGRADAAYARLVDLVRRTSGDDREAARQHLVSLFRLAAPDDPVVGKARRALASALF